MKSHIWDHSMGVFNMNGDNMIENLAHPKRLRLVSLDSTLTPSWPMKTWTNCFTWSDPHRDRLFCHSFWHLIWKYIWYILSDILFWHSFLTWHSIFWHSIVAFYLASILTSYLASFLASILTFSLAFYLAFFLIFYLASILTFFLAFDLAFYLTFFSCILPGILSGIYVDIFSGIVILSDILFGIYSDILFCHFFWHPFWHSSWHLFWHSFWHSIWHCILAFYLASILAFSLTWALPDLNRERQISVGLIWRSRLRSGRHLAEERRRGRGEGRKVGKWGKMQKVWYRLAQVPKFPWLSSKTMI